MIEYADLPTLCVTRAKLSFGLHDITTSAFGTCIQKYVIERYVCLIVFMVIAQTRVQADTTFH